jgi:hypothetical protein
VGQHIDASLDAEGLGLERVRVEKDGQARPVRLVPDLGHQPSVNHRQIRVLAESAFEERLHAYAACQLDRADGRHRRVILQIVPRRQQWCLVGIDDEVGEEAETDWDVERHRIAVQEDQGVAAGIHVWVQWRVAETIQLIMVHRNAEIHECGIAIIQVRAWELLEVLPHDPGVGGHLVRVHPRHEGDVHVRVDQTGDEVLALSRYHRRTRRVVRYRVSINPGDTTVQDEDVAPYDVA